MAIDQRDVSSTLRFMDDRALQQYAAMHKNDPYIFPLAFQESQNRQRLRMGQQGAQGMQPQPKVADQALAQMAPQQLPEDVGIGALPAGNMQFAAEGGIMGYSDDNFAARSEPVVMMAEGGHVPRYQGNARDGSLVTSAPMYDPATGVLIADPAAYGGTDDRTLMERLGIFNPENRRALERAERAEAAKAAKTPGAKAAQAVATMPEQGYTRAGMDNDPRRPPTTTPLPGAAPRADTGPAATRKPAVDPFSMEAMKDAQREAGGDYSGGELRNQAAGIRSALEQQGEERLASRKKEIEGEGDIYKGREERLTKREADIGKQRGENEGLALLNAGLAIMSTPGSLATAIGKGAQVGTAQYASGLKDLRIAQQKLEDARDNIEELRLNRSDMNKREIRALEKERDANINKGNEIMFGVTKDLYGMDREDTRALVKSYAEGQQTKARIESSEKIAGMQERGANARAMTPDKLIFDQLTKQYGGDTVRAAEALQKMKTEKFNVYDAYSKYLQAFAGKDTLKGPDDFDVFAKRFIPTVTPSKNTTVRTQPGG